MGTDAAGPLPPVSGAGRAPRVPLASLALLSASALAYEVLLTRIFAIVHWHHLVGLAIGLALLGYGASGSFLVLAGDVLRRRIGPAYVGNALVFALSAPLCVAAAQRIALDPQAVLWDSVEVWRLAAAFLVLAIPFFAVANCIGLALWRFDRQIAKVYGVDLLGAGGGALLILGGLAVWRPDALLDGILAGGAIAALLGALALGWRPAGSALVAIALIVAGLLVNAPTVRPAAYKDEARALATHGAVTLQRSTGIDGSIRVVGNAQIPNRSAPGLSLQAGALPPPQITVFVDGETIGTIADHGASAAHTHYLADLLTALPFAIAPAPSAVLVANASTGVGVQQAVSGDAAHVVAVEPNAELRTITCDDFAHLQPAVCDPRQVSWHVQAVRAFVAGSDRRFDLVRLSTGAEITGLDALHVDYTLTHEAIGAYLRHLSPQGLLSIDAPTRTPPRLSMRLLRTAAVALRHHGVARPAAHIAMLRGWQRFVLLVAAQPLDAPQRAAIRAFSRAKGFDLVWLPDLRADEANRYQQLASAMFYDGARAILDPQPHGAPTTAAARVAAISDDRPYPHLSTPRPPLRQLFGDARAEQRQRYDSGVVIATVMAMLVGVAAIVLILVPLVVMQLRRGERIRPRLAAATLLYFAAIGVAFLFTEIAWIQRLQLFLGHPVYATTAVLAAFLVFAGAGSLWVQRRAATAGVATLGVAVLLIAGSALAYLYLLPGVLAELAGGALVLRLVAVFVLLAPLAFAMGMPFPLALRALSRQAPGLVPWAWGINGCSSVIAATTAPLLGAAYGFSGLIVSAAAGYLALPMIGLIRRR